MQPSGTRSDFAHIQGPGYSDVFAKSLSSLVELRGALQTFASKDLRLLGFCG